MLFRAWVWLALATTPPGPSGTALVYQPELEMHRAIVDALTDTDRSIVAIAVSERWTSEGPPKKVIALGDAALASANHRWPGRPLAAALVHAPAPEADLTLSAAPNATCTAASLQSEPGRWLVLAAPDDLGASTLSKALDAELATGAPRELQAALRESDADHVWLRAAPSLLNDTWFRYLGLLARGSTWVGSDAVGLSAYGLATPVEIDPLATADRLRAWTKQRRRRNRKQEPVFEGSPCKAPSSDPQPD
ncbi:MAG: hypothetical protein AAGA54_32940 [Myxococcota bacterium]